MTEDLSQLHQDSDAQKDAEARVEIAAFLKKYNAVPGPETTEGKRASMEDYITTFYDTSLLSPAERVGLSRAIPKMSVRLKTETIAIFEQGGEPIIEDLGVFSDTITSDTIQESTRKPHVPNKSTGFFRLTRRSEKEFGDALRDPAVRTAWDDVLASTLVSRRITSEFTIIPFNSPGRKGVFTSLGHEYYAVLRTGTNSAELLYGGMTIPLSALGVYNRSDSLTDFRASFMNWFKDERDAADLDGEALYEQMRGMREVLQPLIGTTITLPEAHYGHIPRAVYDTNYRNNPNQTSTNAPELSAEVADTSAERRQLRDKIRAVLVQYPRMQEEKFFMPDSDELIPFLQKRFQDFSYLIAHPDEMPPAVGVHLKLRAKRYFNKDDLATLEPDELLTVAARSLYTEWEIPYDEVAAFFGDISPRIDAMQMRLHAIGKFKNHVSLSWKTLSLAGNKTLAKRSGSYSAIGRSEGLNMALLNTERTRSNEARKKTVLHEYIHDVQRSTQENGSLPSSMFNTANDQNPTYLEMFTEWLSIQELGPPNPGEESKYNNAVISLNNALKDIKTKIADGSFTTTVDIDQLFYDTAITGDYTAFKDLIRDAFQRDPDEYFLGCSDYDFYKDDVVKKPDTPKSK